MPPLCPRCGHNFNTDAPVKRDGWQIDPCGVIEYGGQRMRIRLSWAIILHSVAACDGVIATDGLLNRISGSEQVKTVHVMISQMKAWLREHGMPLPIESTRSFEVNGYRWTG